MRRLWLAAVFAAITMLASCGGARSSLGYQNGVVSATVRLTAQGEEFKLEVIPEKSVTVLSPECLRGVSLETSDGGWCLAAGDKMIPMTSEALPLAVPITGMFSLPESEAQNLASEDGRLVRVGANGGEYTVKLSPDGEPEHISYDGARSFEVGDIKIEYADGALSK